MAEPVVMGGVLGNAESILAQDELQVPLEPLVGQTMKAIAVGSEETDVAATTERESLGEEATRVGAVLELDDTVLPGVHLSHAANDVVVSREELCQVSTG